LTSGSRSPPILSDHRYSPKFRVDVGGHSKAVFLTIFEHSSNDPLGFGEGFLLALTLGNKLGKRRNKHGKAAALLRLEDNRRAVRPLLPFLNTYRTMCRAPEPSFRRTLEDIRELGLTI